jgi:integrase
MPTEIKALMDNLSIRERTLVQLAVSTGLRQSELFGLKWGDIDLAQNTMNVVRSIVYGVVGPCKTESSHKPVPVHPSILNALTELRQVCRYNKSGDWVLQADGTVAGRRSGARRSCEDIFVLSRNVPEFRRNSDGTRSATTYSTLLRSVGTEFKVMQELLRHSTLRSTLVVYTQAITPAKHAAQAAVMSLVFSCEANATSQLSGSNDVAA